jgi:hypothetical protein
MTDAELVTAIKTANDAAVMTSNDAGVTTAALTDAASVVHADVDAAITSNDAGAIAQAVVDLGLTGIETLAQLNAAYELLVNPTSFTLTTGVNNFSTTSTVNVPFDASTVNSLSNDDVLSGGSGTDTLTANLSNIIVSVNSTGIEAFTLNVANAGAATLDMTNVTGLTAVTNVSSLDDLTLNNLGMIPTVDINTNVDTTTLNFANAAMAGTNDLAISLNGVNAGVVTLTSVAGSTNRIETVSLDSGSIPNAVTLNSDGVSATTVEVTGAHNLDLNTVDDLISTVSASTFTGALTMTARANGTNITTGDGADIITGAAGNDVFTTGGGNDTLNMTNGGVDQSNLGSGNDRVENANLIGATDTMVGGADTDTLDFGGNVANLTALTLVSGFEVVEVDGAITVTVTTDNVTDAGGTITINETGANAAVTVNAAVADGSTVNLGNAGSFTLADGVDNRVTINSGGTDTNADGISNSEVVTLGTGNNN